MQAYIVPIKYAVLSFPLIALALTIPFLIVQYRTHGYVNKFRSVILYSMLLYMISAYFLVILPMPSSFNNCLREGAFWTYSQLKPFTFISDIAKQTQFSLGQPSTYLMLLKETAFLQVIFNVFLTIPLGIYARYYFKRSFKQTMFIALGAALLFETTQITGLFGIYDCPYRLFDVDDLFLNTSGGIIGYLIAPLVTFFLPRTEKLDEHVQLSQLSVGYFRRSIAFMIDLFVLLIMESILMIAWNSITGSSNPFERTTNTIEGWSVFAAINLITVFVYFMLIPSLSNGRTLGKWVTRIHIVDDRIHSEEGQKSISMKALFVRYGMLYYVVFGFSQFLRFVMETAQVPFYIELLLVMLHFGFIAAFVVHIGVNLFKGDKRLFYEKMSHTRNVITEKDNSSQ